MPAVVRLGDVSTGHGVYPSRPNNSGSPNVFINGKNAHRVGDHWIKHCDDENVCHDGVASSGSSNIFVNGKSLCRVGDSISCGDTMATGSPNVFAN